jgi:hypothetical protein
MTCLHEISLSTHQNQLSPTHSPRSSLPPSLEERTRKGKKRKEEGEKERRRYLKLKIVPRCRRCSSTSLPPSHKYKLKNLTLVHSHVQIPCLILFSFDKGDEDYDHHLYPMRVDSNLTSLLHLEAQPQL